MGITGPAIFGVSLRCFKPFIGGALYASIVGPGAAGTVARGLELVYTGKDNPCVPRFTDASMADGRAAPGSRGPAQLFLTFERHPLWG